MRVIIDGREYDTDCFDSEEFRSRAMEYEQILMVVKKAKTTYLGIVKRTMIDVLARELVDVMNIGRVFMKKEDDLPIFYLPDVDFSGQSMFDGAIRHKTRTEVIGAYHRYEMLYKKIMPYWDSYLNAVKIRAGYEKKNLEFVVKYEAKKIIELREDLRGKTKC